MLLQYVIVKGVVVGCHGITMQLVKCSERFSALLCGC